MMDHYDVIVVDDDDLLRSYLVAFLERHGLTVKACRDGREALQVLDRSETRILLTDIFMPEVEGLELIQTVKAKRPNLKIIAVSGGSVALGMDFLPIARRFGADAGLKKPFGPHEVCALVNSLSMNSDAIRSQADAD